MKFSGGAWEGANGREYIATYNYHHDVYNCPGQGILPVAHFSYTRGNKQGGGDIFLKEHLSDEAENVIKINKEIKVAPKTCIISQKGSTRRLKGDFLELQVPRKYDVQIEIERNLPEETAKEILLATYADIAYFCREDIAKNHRGHKVEYVDKIIPKTAVKEVEPQKLLDGGKQWFVPSCLLEANIDFGKGCSTSFIPGDNSSFDGKHFTNWFFAPWGECSYPCYATRMHKSFPKTKHKIDSNKLEKLLLGDFCPGFESKEPLGRPVNILRFGKRTESWNSLFQDSFIETLEIMTKTGTRGVIPTKSLPFDKEIVGLLKKTDSVLLYGIGFDDFEKGAVINGCANDWRLEQMTRYSQEGVRAYPYLHILADALPTQRDMDIINLGFPTQLLPLRFKDKKTCYEISGRNWDELKLMAKQKYFKEFALDTVGHEVEKKWTRSFVHPEWQKIIGDNNREIRMCHHNSSKTYCGGCFQGKGRVVDTVNRF
jgi:hypothetical protein